MLPVAAMGIGPALLRHRKDPSARSISSWRGHSDFARGCSRWNSGLDLRIGHNGNNRRQLAAEFHARRLFQAYTFDHHDCSGRPTARAEICNLWYHQNSLVAP